MNALTQPVPNIRYFDCTDKKFLSLDDPLIKEHEISVVATNINCFAYEAMGSVKFHCQDCSFNRTITTGQDQAESEIALRGEKHILPKATLKGLQTPVVLMKFTIPKVAEKGLFVLLLRREGVPCVLKNEFVVVKAREGTGRNPPSLTGSYG